MFAQIKGIQERYQKAFVEQKILEMGLTKYADKVAGSYSGGNKRKLMVAQAMIGNPPILLFDEPSVGMDPEARHDMWDVIQRMQGVSNVVGPDGKLKKK